MSKKGLEMAIGTVVMLLISVLIFSMSIYFVFKWFGGAEELKTEIDRQTQEQIVSVLKSGNTLVAIPIAIQETGRGKPVTFGMGVRNVAEGKDFSASVSFSGAYDPRGNPIPVNVDYVEDTWLGNFNVIDTFFLQRNEQKLIPLPLRASTNIAEGIPTPKGDYVFNVCVYPAPLTPNGQPPAPCSPGQPFGAFYTEKMYQVTVRVV